MAMGTAMAMGMTLRLKKNLGGRGCWVDRFWYWDLRFHKDFDRLSLTVVVSFGNYDLEFLISRRF